MGGFESLSVIFSCRIGVADGRGDSRATDSAGAGDGTGQGQGQGQGQGRDVRLVHEAPATVVHAGDVKEVHDCRQLIR